MLELYLYLADLLHNKHGSYRDVWCSTRQVRWHEVVYGLRHRVKYIFNSYLNRVIF